MILPSFVVKTDTGIYTITNLEVVRELVFEIEEVSSIYYESVDKRKEYLSAQGLLDNSFYTVNDEFTEVYSYSLVTHTEQGLIEILSVEDLDHGKELLDAVWAVISDPQSPNYIDLGELAKSSN